MPHFNRKIFLLPLLLIACTQSQTADYKLVIRTEQTAIRAEPNEKSREIALLRKGDKLKDLGEVGGFESQIAVGESLVQSPWIKVEKAEKEVGWVLAWALTPPPGQVDWLLEKRLQVYFGRNLTASRKALVQALATLDTEEQLAGVWERSVALRDTFLLLLSRRSAGGFPPQFNWLDEAIPGFLFQKVGGK